MRKVTINGTEFTFDDDTALLYGADGIRFTSNKPPAHEIPDAPNVLRTGLRTGSWSGSFEESVAAFFGPEIQPKVQPPEPLKQGDLFDPDIAPGPAHAGLPFKHIITWPLPSTLPEEPRLDRLRGGAEVEGAYTELLSRMWPILAAGGWWRTRDIAYALGFDPLDISKKVERGRLDHMLRLLRSKNAVTRRARGPGQFRTTWDWAVTWFAVAHPAMRTLRPSFTAITLEPKDWPIA